MNANPAVDEYFEIGCGRCSLVGTPDCKVHQWQDEMKLLRTLLLECGVTEERKWGVPCYTYNGHNFMMLAAFKEYCWISFSKGALLQDPYQILEKPGENTQSGRVVKFTQVDQVKDKLEILRQYIFEAMEVEKAGLKVKRKDISEYEVPEEFQNRLDADPELKEAFESLTPGRRKGYLLHFSSAKQSKTREDRIEKCVPRILMGLGFHDR